jgi:hypothetical protein
MEFRLFYEGIMSPRFILAPTRDRWSGRGYFMGLNGPASLNPFKTPS